MAATIILLLAGCVTHGHIRDVTADNLEAIPVDASVSVTTVEGDEVRLRVTDVGPDHIEGIDRHFREYRFERDEIREIRGRPQNDLFVALAFFAVVFVTGF